MRKNETINSNKVYLSFAFCITSSGRLSNRNSGFNGRWVPQETVLNNHFFRLLVDGDSVDDANPTDRYNLGTQGNDSGEFLVGL